MKISERTGRYLPKFTLLSGRWVCCCCCRSNPTTCSTTAATTATGIVPKGGGQGRGVDALAVGPTKQLTDVGGHVLHDGHPPQVRVGMMMASHHRRRVGVRVMMMMSSSSYPSHQSQSTLRSHPQTQLPLEVGLLVGVVVVHQIRLRGVPLLHGTG